MLINATMLAIPNYALTAWGSKSSKTLEKWWFQNEFKFKSILLTNTFGLFPVVLSGDETWKVFSRSSLIALSSCTYKLFFFFAVMMIKAIRASYTINRYSSYMGGMSTFVKIIICLGNVHKYHSYHLYWSQCNLWSTVLIYGFKTS